MIEEQWMEIKGYNGKYQVSNLGRVKSEKRMVSFGLIKREVKEKILKPCSNGNGYLYVSLGRGVENRRYIHRLVAEAFIANPNNYPQINHKDENRNNNSVDNLEWCDAKYNCNYGTHRQKRYKPVTQYSLKNKYIKTWPSIKEASIFFNGKSRSHIGSCCSGKKTTAFGYKWKYGNKPTPEQVLNALEELMKTIPD